MRAIIFDFDGLIIDTESPAFDAWSAIYREHGVALELERWVACVGGGEAGFDPVRHLALLLGRQVDGAALLAEKDRRKSAICNTLAPLPGVLSVLAAAQSMQLKLAVASSSSGNWVRGHLQRLELLDHFQAVRTRDDVQRVKPDPDLYLAAAEALGEAPEHCLVFEDSLNGVRAAHAAGMRCVAIPGPVTRSLDFSLADACHASLEEVSLVELSTRWSQKWR